MVPISMMMRDRERLLVHLKSERLRRRPSAAQVEVGLLYYAHIPGKDYHTYSARVCVHVGESVITSRSGRLQARIII